MTTSRAPHAIIFDLDGTLVDTVGTRVDSWMAVFPAFGIDPDPAFLAPLMGSDGKLPRAHGRGALRGRAPAR